MRCLRTCVLGLVACLAPVAAKHSKTARRKMLALQDFAQAESVSTTGTLFPGATFHEDTVDDLEQLAPTWRATPKGEGKGSRKSWSWKDPCSKARSTKSPSALKAPSLKAPSVKAPSRKQKKSGAGKGCAEGGSGSESDGAGAEGFFTSSPTAAPIGSTSTSAPGGTISWTWPPGAGGPTVDIPDPGDNSTKCTATMEQSNITVSGATTSTFLADIQVTFTWGDPYVHNGVLALYQSIENILALWVVGCEALAQSLATSLVASSTRRLQETGGIEYVGTTFDFPTINSDCETTGEECVDTIQGTFAIQHTGVSDEVLEGRIVESFQVFSNLIPTLSNQAIQVDQNVTVSKENNREPTNIEGDTLVADDSVNVATVIGATAGGLAFLLLVVLLVRRRTDSDEVTHSKLDEDEDDTFIKEFESNPSGDEGYETRNVHVVGETDSIFSGWTGYTNHGRSRDEADAHESNVHKCSSATCEVCEARRQQGIQFIPTHSPGRPKIPSDASREYLADDTVEL